MTPLPPRYAHQDADVQLLQDLPAVILGLDAGLGKSRIVTDAAVALYEADVIDAVLVVCPAALRSIWSDPDPALGEWTKWCRVPSTIREYSTKTDRLPPLTSSRVLPVLVTNPEFLRRPARLDPLKTWCQARRVLLVVDESWQYQNPHAQQTKALFRLRQACARVVLLNGTMGEIRHQFTQFAIVDATILKMNWWQFKARFCKLGGFMSKVIVGYQREAEFAALTAPFVRLRSLRECVDVGPEPVRTQIEVPLTPRTWKIYCDLKHEFVAWLDGDTAATALQAGVRAMRLAQVVNGFVGGVEGGEGPAPVVIEPHEIGREKLDALVGHLGSPLEAPRKALVFTRFRADVERTVATLTTTFPFHVVRPIYGGQDPDERREAKALLAPGGDPRPAIIVANAASGGAGLNLTEAAVSYFLANDYSRKTRVQAEGRTDRIGQTSRRRFVDILATGPHGERTIDHLIVGALRRQEDLSLASVVAWRAAMAGLDTPTAVV